MNFGRKFYFSVSLLFREIAQKFINIDEPIFMLRNKYEPENKERFLNVFREIILFTYRNEFKNISISKGILKPKSNIKDDSNNITSDIGWGCMYRVTQMSIAYGVRQFLKSYLGDSNIENIIKNFQDNEYAKFSIHNMVNVALSEFGINPTSWIGPTTSSMIADKLINDNRNIISNIQIASIAYIDGTIYKNQAIKHFSEISSDSCTFVWLCMKLGTSKFNISAYKETIISMSNVPQFICIMGGNNYSSGALLIVAFSDTFLYCLDPHIKVLPMFSEKNFSRDEFIQEIPTKIYWEELNPSLSMVYICRNLEDFDGLCSELTRINSDLFEIINNFEIELRSEMEFNSGFLIV
ncbi:peptidase family C54 domain-containing protein [Cryptosporidium ubiquitum]|uniref:Cysteine protease n=1 Tax=Cryptosporidium ubiquitum TaxID=857276 RepID=A0A1J4MLD1_9CRYT|nr:peptidase family C54 domain-containing protein [Cryptosporidium ubiquitum]OII74259.1 peptidase family C54 domain-containing protein [Cryptosporidium ubiquitum]